MPKPVCLHLALPLLLLLASVTPSRGQDPGPVPFPEVRGRNLLDDDVSVPGGLPGHPRLLLIPFHQWQQREVDTWLGRLPELVAAHPGLRAFELPTLPTRYRLMRWVIDGGMKSGIADPEARARTITVYTDRRRFMDSAGIADHDHITVVLLDSAGRIVWRTRGAAEPARWAALVEALEEGVAGGG
jgi:hypothetical protein